MKTYHSFHTALGVCGIAWGKKGIERVELLTKSPRPTASTPPAWVKAVIRKIELHLTGKPQDFSKVRLNLAPLPPFHRKTLKKARAIPCGTVISYGELAKKIGAPLAARAVGQALGKNPLPILIPCHRVLAANHRPGGFSARGGLTTKRKLLAIEGSRHF